MKAIFVLIAICVVLVFVFRGGSSKERANGFEKIFASMPSEEKQFIRAVQRSRFEYDARQNDLAKGATRSERAKAICDAISPGGYSNWFGLVKALSSNGDGKGVLEIEIAPGIVLKTWNNAVSDYADKTLLEPNTQAQQQAMALKSGKSIRFSGSLFSSSTDCVRESSVTLAGSMQSPEFISRFFQFAEVSL